MSSHLAYLVLGSNLENRSTNLANAKIEISALSETKILKESEIYKSPAYGPIDQPFFFNLALTPGSAWNQSGMLVSSRSGGAAAPPGCWISAKHFRG